MNRVELLAPGGDLEKLKIAVLYGADAVYIGGEAFGLRANANNFTVDEIKEGVRFAHSLSAKVYLTLNILAHNDDIEGIADYIENVKTANIDGFIISDPGVMELAKKQAPEVEIHLSTQASCTNRASAEFWYKHGVKRIVPARELTLEEIAEICKNTPVEKEIEIFVHGAMCISYSGRCLLSGYMVNRDGNAGECAHPCRWKYSLVEEERPGVYFPVEEDQYGTYILNSKDLCMIEYIPQLINAGISSFKIEGRAKSSYYTAVVTAAYRKAIDAYYSDPDGYVFRREWLDELCKASHREFYTGFYFGNPFESGQIYRSSSYICTYRFAGMVKSYNSETGFAEIEQRNRIFSDDEIEILRPDGTFFVQKAGVMLNTSGEEITVAPHPKMVFYIKTAEPVTEMSIIRKGV